MAYINSRHSGDNPLLCSDLVLIDIHVFFTNQVLSIVNPVFRPIMLSEVLQLQTGMKNYTI
jgi:hypothetical protein